MPTSTLKRILFRVLLVGHFLGLTLAVGVRFADFVVDTQTGGQTGGQTGALGLQTLSLGQQLTGTLAATLVAPGFVLMIFTGVSMTLLRYGVRPPFWVWLKIGVTVVAVVIAQAKVAPALSAARRWAHWSAEHNRLAPQFHDSTAQAALFGAVVFGLFLINIPVAVWKPFAALRWPAPRAKPAPHQA